MNYDGRQKYCENLCGVNKMQVEVARISFGSGEIVLQAGHYHVYADCGDEQAHYF